MAAVQLQPDDIIFVPESGRSQLARFLDDFVNRPVQSINQGLAIYVNYRWVSILR
jgi:hypothetical protein